MDDDISINGIEALLTVPSSLLVSVVKTETDVKLLHDVVVAGAKLDKLRAMFQQKCSDAATLAVAMEEVEFASSSIEPSVISTVPCLADGLHIVERQMDVIVTCANECTALLSQHCQSLEGIVQKQKDIIHDLQMQGLDFSILESLIASKRALIHLANAIVCRIQSLMFNPQLLRGATAFPQVAANYPFVEDSPSSQSLESKHDMSGGSSSVLHPESRGNSQQKCGTLDTSVNVADGAGHAVGAVGAGGAGGAVGAVGAGGAGGAGGADADGNGYYESPASRKRQRQHCSDSSMSPIQAGSQGSMIMSQQSLAGAVAAVSVGGPLFSSGSGDRSGGEDVAMADGQDPSFVQSDSGGADDRNGVGGATGAVTAGGQRQSLEACNVDHNGDRSGETDRVSDSLPGSQVDISSQIDRTLTPPVDGPKAPSQGSATARPAAVDEGVPASRVATQAERDDQHDAGNGAGIESMAEAESCADQARSQQSDSSDDGLGDDGVEVGTLPQ